MKEYKLLKKYPSLATDWEVGMKVGLGDRNYGYSPCAGNYSDCRKLDNSEVENNSEFWEEVVEKDYEILSFLNPDNKEEYTFECGVLFAYAGSYRSLSYCMEHYKIQSVKRLSDGHIFQIGNRAKTAGKSNYSHIITSFEVKQKITGKHIDNTWIYDGVDRIWLNWEENAGGNWLESSEKVKEPLFIPFDGEKIYKGHAFYAVDNYFNEWYIPCYGSDNLEIPSSWVIFADKNKAEEYIRTFKNYKTVDGKQIKEGDVFYCYDNKRFKCIETKFGQFKSSKWDGKRYRTKEEVEELILMNKPCLSLNDLLDAWGEDTEFYKTSSLFLKFKSLVK